MNVDYWLKKAGGLNRYHWLMFLGALIWLTSRTYHNVGSVFFAATPQFWCRNEALASNNVTGSEILRRTSPWNEDLKKHDGCLIFDRNDSSSNSTKTVKCPTGWSYNRSQYASTIVTEWNLVCDRSWLKALSTSLYYVTMGVGLLVFGFLGDFLGRKKAASIGIAIQLVSSVAAAFAPSLIVFSILRCLLSFSHQGAVTNYYVLMTESIEPRWRSLAGFIGSSTWGINYALLGLWGYLIRDWRYLQGIISATVLLFIPFIFLSQESPRWLIRKNRLSAARIALSRIAKINGRKLLESEIEFSGLDDEARIPYRSIFQTCRYPRLLIRMCTLFVCWFTISFVYYGLSLGTAELSGDPYLNMVWSGLIEIPFRFLFQMLLMDSKLGRRWCFCSQFILCGTCLLLTLTMPYKSTGAATLSLIGKGCTAALFGITYTYSAELIPTEIRTSAVSLCSLWARIGGALAPLVNEAGRQAFRELPAILFGSVALVTGICCFFLPETLGTALPNTLEQGNEVKLKQFFSFADSEAVRERGFWNIFLRQKPENDDNEDYPLDRKGNPE